LTAEVGSGLRRREDVTELSGVDPHAFRELMGDVAAPVTVITAITGAGHPHGTTVSAFCSVSLEPPLVAVMLDNRSDLLRLVRRTRRFGVNVLSEDQGALAMTFATKGGSRFDGVDWRASEGLPRLRGASAWIACSVERSTRGGDHAIVIGRVLQGESEPQAPLIYHHRRFGTHSAYTWGAKG
jgi:flavin reductase (DIM6/NTAB) family NADH-FMN oxidoreductase RutF